MWRVHADIQMAGGNPRLFKARDNPIENMRDFEFQERYRFPKDVVIELLDILEPSLVRNTHRYV